MNHQDCTVVDESAAVKTYIKTSCDGNALNVNTYTDENCQHPVEKAFGYEDNSVSGDSGAMVEVKSGSSITEDWGECHGGVRRKLKSGKKDKKDSSKKISKKDKGKSKDKKKKKGKGMDWSSSDEIVIRTGAK